MLRIPRLVWRDPALRMVAGGVLLFGAFAASVGIHQSLLAVKVFGLSDGQYAWLLLVAVLVSVAASVAIGVRTDRRGGRRAMALGAVAASAAGAALVWAAPSAWAFAVAHAVLLPVGGTVFGQLFALARLASNRYPPASRDAILSVLRALFAVPFVVVLPLWGLAFARGATLPMIYPVVLAVAVLHAAFTWWAWPRGAERWHAPASNLSLRAALGEMAEPGILARTALIGAVHAPPALAGVLVGLTLAEAGRPTGDVGLFFGGFVAVEVAATLLVGPLAARSPRLAVIAAGVVAYAGYLALLPLLAPSPWLWALLLPAGVGGGLVYTLAIAYLQDLLRARPGAGSALIAVQRLSAEGLMAAAYGVGAAVGGYAAVGIGGAAMGLAAMAALLALDSPQASKNPGPAA